MVNGFIISQFKLNTMIVTLGTQTLFLGISLGIFQFPEVTATLPRALINFGELYLFEVFSPAGLRSVMPIAVIPFILLAILVWFILNHTMFGRSLYAIGGNEVSAERAGINVKRTKFLLYCFVGLMAGMIGILRVTMARQSIPMGLIGWDLMVIPAVILGGASIYGGAGSVFGTITAVALVSVVTNSLLLIGISSAWQDFVYGLVILSGVTVSAVQVMRKRRKEGLT
jgi:simple sugar transport system permease protein